MFLIIYWGKQIQRDMDYYSQYTLIKIMVHWIWGTFPTSILCTKHKNLNVCAKHTSFQLFFLRVQCTTATLGPIPCCGIRVGIETEVCQSDTLTFLHKRNGETLQSLSQHPFNIFLFNYGHWNKFCCYEVHWPRFYSHSTLALGYILKGSYGQV